MVPRIGIIGTWARGLSAKERHSSPEKVRLARKLYADTSLSVAEIYKMLGISQRT
jgi:hypothetical protein